MKKLLSILTLILISAGTLVSAQTDNLRANARIKLRNAKKEIVYGDASKTFNLLRDLWQDNIPEDIRGEALYLSATLAEYAIGRDCNQPNAMISYEDAAALGDKKAKEALRRINEYGFAKPTEANRNAIISQMKYELNREIFRDTAKSKLPMEIDEGLIWTNVTALTAKTNISLFYKIPDNSPILAGANNIESLIEKVNSIPADHLLKGWSADMLFQELNLSAIGFHFYIIKNNNFGTLNIHRTLLRSGEEQPTRITTRN